MDTSFTAALAFTRTEEGGYTESAEDSGNWSSGVCGHGTLIGSNMGVGAPALVSWMGARFEVTSAYMRALPATTYQAIARARYWRTMGCDTLPAGLDLTVFDFGWNRGDGTSVRLLQGMVGATMDGDCGAGTLAAVAAYGPTSNLIADLCAAQTSSYHALANFEAYGAGWLARTKRRAAAAQALVGSAPAAPTADSLNAIELAGLGS